MSPVSRKIFVLMKTSKERGVENSSEAYPFVEVPLAYKILSGECTYAVPPHCLAGTAVKAVWILCIYYRGFYFQCHLHA